MSYSELNPDFHQDSLNIAKELDKSGRLNPSDQKSKPDGKTSPAEKMNPRYLHPESFIDEINTRYK